MAKATIKTKNQLLKDIFCASVPDDVITFDKIGNAYVNSEKLDETQLDVLKSEAAFIVKSRLWTLITNSLAETAKKTMFEKSESFDDMMSGKMLLYAIDVQRKIIEKLLSRSK